VLYAVAAHLGAQASRPGGIQDLQISAQQQDECLAGGAARFSRHLRTHAVRFVGADRGRPIRNPRPSDAARSPEAAARAYLSNCGALFGLIDQSAELKATRSTAADRQRTVVRFQQIHNGIPVLGGELIVHLDASRNILAVAGKTLPNAGSPPSAVVDATAAARTALDLVASAYGLPADSLTTSAPQLWTYAPALLGGEDGPAVLVWRMDVLTRGLSPVRELVLVDAQQGSVRLHFNQVETIRNRLTYTTGNTQNLPGNPVCDESNPTCVGGDADAVAAHLYAGDTYDFYASNYGRDSLDNAGLTLTSTVHYGPIGFLNAFWNSAQMVYGDGFSQADDIVGHELTHGVTQYTSGLFYYYQSGAINESLSDVFGELIDQSNGHGNDTPEVRWLIGEDIPGIGAIRNMKDPTAFNDPDRMTSAFYTRDDADNGGVHRNSGVNNKAAYLMVDGGTFNGQTVAALGALKVGKIYYEVQTHLLTSGSDYGDLSDALYQGCTNLVGTSAITAADCQQVRNATLAVEMNLEPVPGFNPDAPVCSTGLTPVNSFFDDLESGMDNFSVDATVGQPRWTTIRQFAHSGVTSLWGDDFPAATADSSVSLANGIVLPANAYLHFSHAFAFEGPDRDGGVVEYSTNNGSTWNDAAPLFDANGYTGVLASGFGNPLAGRFAFIGLSHGYMSSRLNLSSLAGQTVRFRWRLALDSANFVMGWFVDDIRIYTCAGPKLTQISPASGFQGQSLTVAVTGQASHFVQGLTTANVGAGISVTGVTVTDPTHANLDISIAANSAPGGRDVVVTTGAEQAVATNAFTVIMPPLVTLVLPNVAQPGSNVTAVVKGQLTHFVQGQTGATFGPGITVNGVTINDATDAIVNLTIAGNAVLGTRNVTLTTGAEAVTLTNGFAVTSAPADVHALAYVVGRRQPASDGSNGLQTVSVIDTATNAIVNTIPAGQGCLCIGPDGVALTPDGALAYVTNELENTLSVIRTASNSVIATLPVGSGPTSAAMSPDGQRVYVLNGSGTTSVSVISTMTDAVLATIPLGVPQARGMAIVPDGSRLYVATYGSNSVIVVNTASLAVVNEISVGNLPAGVDITPDGSSAYVPNFLGNTVSVIDTAADSVTATINVASNPSSARVTPDGQRAYVVSQTGVTVINTQTNSVVAAIPGLGGSTLEFTPDGSRAYIATYTNVSIIDTATNTVVGGVAFDQSTNGGATALAITGGATRVLSLGGILPFGAVRLGLSATATLVISNSGNSPLTVGSLTLPPGFTSNWNGGVIAPGTSREVVLTFSPVSKAFYGGIVTVNSNRTSGTPTIAVSGIGTTGIARPLDFDADGRRDIAIYRPSSGNWYFLSSGSGFTAGSGYSWGVSGDVPVPGDYDGDGQTDLAIYRPSTGQWFLLPSSTNYTTGLSYQWGISGDVPVPGDYDGDGKTDLAIYRPSTGTWFVLNSSSRFTAGAAYVWGVGGDMPVPGDYDGDGRTDIAVYRPSSGHWFILKSSANFAANAVYQWGAPGDVPVGADYDGDGKVDLAIYRPSVGTWYILPSITNYTSGLGYAWGSGADVPVPGDFDGDGKADIVVYRPSSGYWFILNSSSGYSTSAVYQWGAVGDVPLASR
jgi:YVTN family beta-propeller protein